MKKKLITLLFVFTIINIFGQTPTIAKDTKTTDSNNQVSTVNDVVTHKTIKPITKAALDET
ncbi:pyrrolo-quinoline quinone, partial [Flavobacterium sp. LBUM151]